MSDISRAETELNQMILTGRAMEGFEKYYAEDTSMQENTDPPCVGKAANRERELQFFSNVQEFHGATLGAVVVGDDVSFSEWVLDVTFKGGNRITMTQVARRKWRDGLIVDERFYYKPAY
ncbi:SnoaL-like domain-containing protein [Nannocystaceae bacterium ST9]